MKKALIASLLIVAACLSGCASLEKTLNDLPQISAAEIHAETSNPIATVTVDATNLESTPTRTTADTLTVHLAGPFIGATTVRFKRYVRDKKLPLIAEPPPPPPSP